MEYKFTLRKITDEKTPAQVYLMARLDSKKFLYYTRQKVAPKYWKGTRMDRKINGHRKVNDVMQKVVRTFDFCVEHLENKDELNADNLKNMMDYKLGRIRKDEYLGSGDMLEFFDRALRVMESRGKKIDSYKSAIRRLREFKWDINWENINTKTYLDWQYYMENDPKRPLSKNTISHYTTLMKRLFNMAMEEGVYEFSLRDIRGWKCGSELTTKIALSEKEVNALMALKLEGTREDARDLFVIGCCTGLRSGDYRRINPETDIKKEIIHMVTQKTGEEVMIPAHFHLLDILKKRNWMLPKIKYETLLDNIGKVAKESGLFDDLIKKVITIGGVKKEIMVPRWTMITTHTARRSFATILRHYNVPDITVMKLTGHKTVDSFERYIRLEKEKAIEDVQDSDFFKRDRIGLKR